MGNYSLPTKQKRFEEMQSTLEGYEKREIKLRQERNEFRAAVQLALNAFEHAWAIDWNEFQELLDRYPE